MTDDEMEELQTILKRAAELLPKLRAPLAQCDEKWADLVEGCVLEDLLGKRRVARLRGHMAADALQYGNEVEEGLKQATRRLRKA